MLKASLGNLLLLATAINRTAAIVRNANAFQLFALNSRKSTLTHTSPDRTLFTTRLTLHTRNFSSKLLMNGQEVVNDERDSGAHTNLLWEWATHSDEKIHDFTTEEAEAIRSKLLVWYRANRRKLPWRGDPEPYDGSTAGIATSSKVKKKARKDKQVAKGQKNIKSFFQSNSSEEKKGTRSETESTSAESLLEKSELDIIPITGYSVWVSEIMLQQTRVEAVIPYYLKWMKSFPTVEALANASEEEVNSHWAGLGFYRRARLLHKGAKFVCDDLNGVVPDSVDELLNVSGIGRYTASAISSIAFDKCVPVVDGNVCRVISRLKGVANNIKAPIFKDKLGWGLAEQIVSSGDGKYAGEVNQALMELGATYCAPSGTGVDKDDPLVEFYMSTKIGEAVNELVKHDPMAVSNFVYKISKQMVKSKCKLCEETGVESILFQLGEDLVSIEKNPELLNNAAAILGHSRFPTNPPKKNKREEILGVAALSHNIDADEKWFMVKRPKDGLLAGQWEFPNSCLWNSSSVEKKGSGKSKAKKAIEIPIMNRLDTSNAVSKLLSDFYIEELNDVSLQDIWIQSEAQRILVNDDTAIEHIFSHVRWSMFCDHTDVSSSLETLQEFQAIYEDRECRWMSESDMQKVGITSSVKKLLAAIKTRRNAGNPKKRRKIKK